MSSSLVRVDCFWCERYKCRQYMESLRFLTPAQANGYPRRQGKRAFDDEQYACCNQDETYSFKMENKVLECCLYRLKILLHAMSIFYFNCLSKDMWPGLKDIAWRIAVLEHDNV